MAKKLIKGCSVGCDLPCIREGCPYWNTWELTCDECGTEVGELFKYDGQELCEDCLEAKAKHVNWKCGECGAQSSEMVEYEGKYICIDCFTMKVLGKKIPFVRFWCDECSDWVSDIYFDESGAPMCKECLKKQNEVKE